MLVVLMRTTPLVVFLSSSLKCVIRVVYSSSKRLVIARYPNYTWGVSRDALNILLSSVYDNAHIYMYIGRCMDVCTYNKMSMRCGIIHRRYLLCLSLSFILYNDGINVRVYP